jgi:hypothetical protein
MTGVALSGVYGGVYVGGFFTAGEAVQVDPIKPTLKAPGIN